MLFGKKWAMATKFVQWHNCLYSLIKVNARKIRIMNHYQFNEGKKTHENVEDKALISTTGVQKPKRIPYASFRHHKS